MRVHTGTEFCHVFGSDSELKMYVKLFGGVTPKKCAKSYLL